MARLFNITQVAVGKYRKRKDRPLHGTNIARGMKPRWYYTVEEVEAFAAYHGLLPNWTAIDEE